VYKDNPTDIRVEYMGPGEIERAIEQSEALRPSAPARAAINWAAIYVYKRRYCEALKILSRADRNPKNKSRDHLRDIAVSRLFEQIVRIISYSQPSGTSEPKKNHLLRLLTPGIVVWLWLLDVLGKFSVQIGIPSGDRIRKLAEGCRLQSWIHGFAVKPGFAAGRVKTEKLEGYEHAVDVYREVFIAYLEYWVSSRGEIRDLLLGTVQLEDAIALYSIIRQRKPQVVLEIGTFVGFSTCIMARALKDNGKGVIHCVDPDLDFLSVRNPLKHARQMLQSLGLDDHACVHVGFFSEPRGSIGSKIEVLGRKISEIVPRIDLAFIDGDHATNAVLQDFMLLLPALSAHAAVMFHDVGWWPSVRQALVNIFQDTIYKQQMRYLEVSPQGKDGLAVVEINKEAVLVEKSGADKWTSV